MNDIFILDIETTGVDKEKDSIIEIGIVHAKRMSLGKFFLPMRTYHRTLPTNKKVSEWAKEYPGQVNLFNKCNEQFAIGERQDADYKYLLREEIQEFFKLCDVKSPMLSGLNIVGFDIAFLKRDGILRDGDYNYRSWCLTPIIESICHVNGIDSSISSDREKVSKHLVGMTPVEISVPGASTLEHTALHDCEKELKMLNSSIALMNAIPKLNLN